MAFKILNYMPLSHRAAVAILITIFALALPLVARLSANNKIEVFFPASHKTVAFERALRKHFPETGSLIAVFNGEDLYDPARLAALGDITKDMEKLPQVDRVQSVTTYEQVRATADGFSVSPLAPPDDLRAHSPREWREKFLADRFAPGVVVAHDGAALAIVVRMKPGYVDLDAATVRAKLNALVKDKGLADHFVGFTGEAGMQAAFLDSMIGDNARMIPACLAIGVILIWALFRNWLATFLTVVVMMAASLTSLAAVSLIAGAMTLATSMCAPVVITLTIALAIHLFNAIVETPAEGKTQRERITEAVKLIERPARYTTLTTVAGFVSVGFSPSPPLSAFGFSSALGVIMLHILTIFVLPPILARWDKSAWRKAKFGIGLADATADAAARLTLRRPGLIVFTSVALALAGLPLIGRIAVETDNVKMLPATHPFTRANDFFERHFSGVTVLEAVFDGGKRDALVDPARLKAISDFEQWALTQPEIDYTASMADIVEEMNWAFNGEKPDARKIPENARLISQYLLIYDGRDLSELSDPDYATTRVPLFLNVHGTREIKRVIGEMEEHLRGQKLDMSWRIAGAGRLFADFEKLVVDSQIKSAFGACAIIFALMALAWRSVRDAALCLWPNVAPLLYVLALMGLVGTPLNVGTAIVTSVALGIAVDDTVHMFNAIKSRLSAGMTVNGAVTSAMESCGRAIIATSVVICSSFLLLAGSGFKPTRDFGVMITLGLVAALVFDLLVLPAMVVLTYRGKEKSAATRRRRASTLQPVPQSLSR